MSSVDQILAATMALSPEDRAELANRLFESVDNAEEFDQDEELEQTICDRLEAYDRGEIAASDWEDVKVNIEAGLDQKRRA